MGNSLPPLLDPTRCLTALEAGGIVLLPMDTVYGLACRADLDQAVESLYRLKNRPDDKAFALAFPTLEALLAHLQPSRSLQETLALLLPGPITLVLDTPAHCTHLLKRWPTTVGVRVPGPSPSSPVFADLSWPLVLTSANRAGEPTWDGAQPLPGDLVAGISGRLPGAPGGQMASTVVRLGTTGWTLLRDGAVSRQTLMERLGPEREVRP